MDSCDIADGNGAAAAVRGTEYCGSLAVALDTTAAATPTDRRVAAVW